MVPSANHLELAPPRQGHWLGPVGLALVAHGLLIGALTWGVHWNRDESPAVFEAELWSRLPQEAAPRAAQPPPPPPAPRPEPQPAPPPPAPAPAPQADIAVQQARKKAEEAQRLAEEKREAQAARREAERKAQLEKQQAEKERQQKLAAEQKRERERQEADDQRRDQLRQEQMARMMGQAGASGGPQARGNAAQSSGPSAGYGARVAARIRPNVVFTESAPGNPRAEVEVRALPDGTITSSRLIKSSGNPAWDDAVLRAIDRTGNLPRDTDGRVPATLIIGLRPQD